MPLVVDYSFRGYRNFSLGGFFPQIVQVAVRTNGVFDPLIVFATV